MIANGSCRSVTSLAPRRADAAVALALGHEPPIAVAQKLERLPR